MLELMVSTQAATPKPNFDINLVESWKHSIEEPVLLNFVNLPKIWLKIVDYR